MSTNQEIWGDEADWIVYNSSFTGTTKENAPLTGNFGEGYYISSVHYNSSCLQTGFYHDILPIYRGSHSAAVINEPLDNSISYCGLGNESVYSRLAYLEYKISMFDSGFKNVDDRAVTNFAFCASQGSNGGFYAYNDSSASAASSATQADICRFAPLGLNGDYTSISRANFNRQVAPYVSIPVRNFILTPVIRAANTINTTTPTSTSGMDIRSFDWWDYMNITQQRNYTTHPYILGIGIKIFSSRQLDTIDPVTGVPQSTRVTLGYGTDLSGIAVLSPLSICDNEYSDIANPESVQSDIYSYYLTRSNKASGGNSAAIPIFGYSAIDRNDRDYIVAPQTNSDTDASPFRLIFWTHPNAQLVKVSTSSGYTQSGWYYLEYYDDLVDWVREQIACFGLFFTLDKNTAQTGALNDPLMYLGILDANGIGHGEYTSGEDNEDQPQWEWDTTNNSSYKPSDGGGDDDPYSDSTKHIIAGSGVNVGGKWYADSNLSVWNGLLSWCNAIPLEGDGAVDKSLFFGQNPIDCIIEGKYIFVTDYTFGKAMQSSAPISLGSYTTGGVNSYPFTLSKPTTFNCGSVAIKRPFGDFRDMSPFTTITLLLPFAGSIDLPTEIFMGHTCNLKETIDPLTGDLIYYVSVDNIDYCKINGNCAMDLAINGLETATLAQTRYRLQTQEVTSSLGALQSLIGGVSGGLIASTYGNVEGAISQMLGGVVGAVKGQWQADRAGLERSVTGAPPAKISKSSSNVEWGDMLFPQIVIATALMLEGYNETEYKSKTGFATYKIDTIGNQSGPVVCRNVVINSIDCTTEEKVMIKQALESGVYIK